ncbi:hypothetical protein NADFUDRAFT_52267 [Nadsonia fulvescens var. elongata DSM 6958]|uniref:SURP motif domain-containing protein n=1 Tax=Nadsonia fulvescens var. elongata DSM 6958 TaxID=857566 RepID=A0A1E3PGS0_9ASCO|nr:hypothetical protein NADFUDRAFT_52267 [Nadsonia fulvescens var. elongata DSM 6958]
MSTEREATPSESLPEIKVPEGIIIPPQHICDDIERTAAYVSRNGSLFEERLRESKKNEKRFSFLDPEDSYNAYYLFRYKEHKSGRATAVSNSKEDNVDGSATDENQLKQSSNTPKAPAPLLFCPTEPLISALDADIVKVTALYAAVNGPDFVTELARRQALSQQYNFLKPNHSFYGYFQSLINQYKLVISHSNELKERLKDGVERPYHILEKAKDRAEYTVFAQNRAKKLQEEKLAEQKAYEEIDWHDFVVVETIEFTEDDRTNDLPAPLSLTQVKFAKLENRGAGGVLERIEESMPGEMDNYIQPESVSKLSENATDITAEKSPEVEAKESHPKTIRNPLQSTTGPPNMKIRAAGTTRLAKKNRPTNTSEFIQCPFTGEQIPAEKFEEHMRIMLMDPKWKEQKAKADSRASTTNITSAADIAVNAKRFASALGGNDAIETANKKAKKSAVQWDGRYSTMSAAKAQAAFNAGTEEEQKLRAEAEYSKMNTIGPGSKSDKA